MNQDSYLSFNLFFSQLGNDLGEVSPDLLLEHLGHLPEHHSLPVAHDCKNLLQDPEQQRELGARAREKVGRDFSLDRQVDRIEETYRKALFRRGGAEALAKATRAPDRKAQSGDRG